MEKMAVEANETTLESPEAKEEPNVSENEDIITSPEEIGEPVETPAEKSAEESSDIASDVDKDVIEDDAGKKFVPYEAFKGRIDALTSKLRQAEESAALLETIKSNPSLMKQLVESFSSGEELKTSSEKADKQPSSFERFLAPLPKEHQAHYRNMINSVAEEFEDYVQVELKKALQPFVSWVGSEKIRNFEHQNKDFGKYKSTVTRILNEGRAKNLEDALILASHEDKLKSVKNVLTKEEQIRRTKLASTPFPNKTSSGGIGTSNKTKLGLRESIEAASEQIGWLRQQA